MTPGSRHTAAKSTQRLLLARRVNFLVYPNIVRAWNIYVTVCENPEEKTVKLMQCVPDYVMRLFEDNEERRIGTIENVNDVCRWVITDKHSWFYQIVTQFNSIISLSSYKFSHTFCLKIQVKLYLPRKKGERWGWNWWWKYHHDSSR